MSAAARFAPPFFCPYCGEEDIRPYESAPVEVEAGDAETGDQVDTDRKSGEAYSCESCLRTYSLLLLRNRGGV